MASGDLAGIASPSDAESDDEDLPEGFDGATAEDEDIQNVSREETTPKKKKGGTEKKDPRKVIAKVKEASGQARPKKGGRPQAKKR